MSIFGIIDKLESPAPKQQQSQQASSAPAPIHSAANDQVHLSDEAHDTLAGWHGPSPQQKLQDALNQQHDYDSAHPDRGLFGDLTHFDEIGQRIQYQQAVKQAQAAMPWNSADDVRANLAQNPDLGSYSDDQMQTLEQLSGSDSPLHDDIQSAVARQVSSSKKIDALPTSKPFQQMLQSLVLQPDGSAPSDVQNARSHAHDLVNQAVDNLYDGDVSSDLKGKQAVQDAVGQFGNSVSDLESAAPALAQQLYNKANDELNDQGHQQQMQQMSQASSGGGSWLDTAEGALGDAISYAGDVNPLKAPLDLLSNTGLAQKGLDLTGDVMSAPASLEGTVARNILDGGSSLVADGLDTVHLSSAADDVRSWGHAAGNTIHDVAQKNSGYTRDFWGGVGSGAQGFVDGTDHAVNHPAQTLQGLGVMALHSPIFIPLRSAINHKSYSDLAKDDLSYDRGVVDAEVHSYQNTADKYGAAGALGRATFDIGTLIATDGAGSEATVTGDAVEATEAIGDATRGLDMAADGSAPTAEAAQQAAEPVPWEPRTNADGSTSYERQYTDENGVPTVESVLGNNRWRSPDFQALVDRATQEGTTAFDTVGGDGNPLTIRVNGNATPEQLSNLRAAIEAAPPNVRQFMTNINLTDNAGDILNMDGSIQTSVGGLANGRSIVVARDQLATVENAQYVLYHEAGHVLDFRLGGVSTEAETPFGSGEFVSNYASTNPLEDFAETTRVTLDDAPRLAELDPEAWANEVAAEKKQFILKLLGIG